MSFPLESTASNDAKSLASMMWNFVTTETPYRLSRNSADADDWCPVFESLLKEHTCKAIKKVLRLYFDGVRNESYYVHTDAETFRKAFPALYRHCKRRYNPLNSADVAPLLEEFSQCHFDCDKTVLEATLGQSLLALRLFKSALDQSNLSQAKKDYIRVTMGTAFSYIRKKLLPKKPWIWNRTYRLPKPITYDSLCEEAVGLLRAYGVSRAELKRLF